MRSRAYGSEIGCAAFILLLIGAFLLTRGPAAPTANPPGSFSFAVLGDAPYNVFEDMQFRIVLQDLQAHDLTSAIHIGDIFWRPCSDDLYRRTLAWFNGLRHPLIYTPGDNEWTDCWEPRSGGFAPRERLDRLRQIFFARPTRSLGGRPISLVSQGGPFVENARWTHEGIVFATVHLVGSRNGLRPFPGRVEADDVEVRDRTQAATVWMRQTFAEARSANAPAVVVAFHGNPFSRFAPALQPFLTALEEEVERFRRPVLVAHGDHHNFIVDRPIGRLENLTRLEVPGSPDVGWVRVVVMPGAANPFTFEPRVIPRWKYW